MPYLLKNIVNFYMKKVPGIEEYCTRCLKTERWGGKVVLMVVDAAFTSIGLNYFTIVVPKVKEFSDKFVDSGKITNLKELAGTDITKLRKIWKNERSWMVAKNIAKYLSALSENSNDKTAFRSWSKNTNFERWTMDPIGSIKGVGLVTFQYLRMMGGIDTVMPDKIVKKVINEIFEKSNLRPINDNMDFVTKLEKYALSCGFRPIELCWMTWLIQPEGKRTRMSKNSDILSKI